MEKETYLNSLLWQRLENSIKYRRKINEETNEQYYESLIHLSQLERIVSEEELEDAFNLLNDKGVLVLGDSPVLYGDFENYRYVKPLKTNKSSNLFDEEKFNELMYRYKSMIVVTDEDKKQRQNIRKEIISMNVKLVDFVIDRINNSNCYNRDELASYGYEGLINAVDNFSLDRGKFSTYATHCIIGNIKKGLIKIKGFNSECFYFKYLDVKNCLEKELGLTIDTDFDYLDEIAIRILSKDKKPIDTVENVKDRISLMSVMSLDEEDYVFYDDNDVYNEIIEDVNADVLKKDINNILSNLTEKQRLAIIKLYGLEDNNPQSYSDIAREFNCSHTNIQDLERKALKNLRKGIADNLIGYWEVMNNCSFNVFPRINVKENSYEKKRRA